MSYITFFDRIPVIYAAMPRETITIIETDGEPIKSLWLRASTAKALNALGLGLTQIYICYAQGIQ